MRKYFFVLLLCACDSQIPRTPPPPPTPQQQQVARKFRRENITKMEQGLVAIEAQLAKETDPKKQKTLSDYREKIRKVLAQWKKNP